MLISEHFSGTITLAHILQLYTGNQSQVKCDPVYLCGDNAFTENANKNIRALACHWKKLVSNEKYIDAQFPTNIDEYIFVCIGGGVWIIFSKMKWVVEIIFWDKSSPNIQV